jgi:cytochrome c biogenesis protein CcmG, thiol:disulfide interchange protein DsbE
MSSDQHLEPTNRHEHSNDEAPVADDGSEAPITLRDRIIPFTALGLLIVLIGVFAYTLYTPTSSSLGAGGRVNATGSKVYLGDRLAPDFTLETFDGQEVSLSDFEGQSVVINFWSSWCPPCRDEAPMLNAFHEQTMDQDDVVLIGVAVWDRREDSLEFMRRHNLSFLNLADQRGSVLIDYGVYGVPETYFIGPDGTLHGKYRGPLESAEHINELKNEFAGDSTGSARPPELRTGEFWPPRIGELPIATPGRT